MGWRSGRTRETPPFRQSRTTLNVHMHWWFHLDEFYTEMSRSRAVRDGEMKSAPLSAAHFMV